VIVVADTSVLVNLCRVRQDRLLLLLFKEVVIPEEVAQEFARLVSDMPRFSGLVLPDGIRQQSPARLLPQVGPKSGLDVGEAAALSLAVEIHADAVLVDERRGHEVAVQLGLRVIGVIGILLEAKSRGLLTAVAPVLDSLQRDAGFWISDSLRQRILRIAGEIS
jgi:predicted nucleic acid-binding protein